MDYRTTMLPDWAIVEIKEAFAELSTWQKVRFRIKPLCEKLGFPITLDVVLGKESIGHGLVYVE